MQTEIPTQVIRQAHRFRAFRALGIGLFLLAGLIFTANYLIVHHPVSTRLHTDKRNNGFALWCHYRYYLDPNTVVLDLREVDDVAPVDLFRGIFQAAEALESAGLNFNRVIFARSGRPVFAMTGDDFLTIGLEFSLGQNPVYLMRTFPEKLVLPDDGQSAFGKWEGRWLGVVGKQMEDVNAVAEVWVKGHP